jgi:hypothetical protein
MSNTFIVAYVNDLYILNLSLYKYVDSIYYLIIRPFDKNDFPKNIKRISIQYCMVDQNLENLPPSIEEISFYQNVDNIDLYTIPHTIKKISFEYFVNQNIIDNLPPWIEELHIYFKPTFCKYSLTFDNLPVRLKKIKFHNRDWSNIKLDFIPVLCECI